MSTKSTIFPVVGPEPKYRSGELYIHPPNDLVVLVSPEDAHPGKFAGSVVHGGRSAVSVVGDYSNEWRKATFAPYYGTLTLESV